MKKRGYHQQAVKRHYGGKARMARLVAKERSVLARRAALARWRCA
jgi:hypothetical protein